MKPRRIAMLIPLAALASCGGNTLRVAADSDSAAAHPVALAPAPVVDSGPRPVAAAQPAETSAGPNSQGYAPYGNRDLEVRRIGQWSHTGIGEARRMVIRDANGFAELWSELGA